MQQTVVLIFNIYNSWIYFFSPSALITLYVPAQREMLHPVPVLAVC
jgi:hypothetical protein